MIPVTFSWAVLIYLCATLIGVLLAWVRFEKNDVFRRYPEKLRVVRNCPICAHTYVDSHLEDLSRCPQCGSLNRRKESLKDTEGA